MSNIALFLGGFYSSNDISRLMINSKTPLSWANNKLQWAYIEGLKYYYKYIYALSAPQIGSFPFRYKKIYFRSDSDDDVIKYSSFLNITYIKKFARKRVIYKAALKILRQLEQDVSVDLFVYDLDYSLLQAAIDLKKRFDNINLCVIVPDLPDLIGRENRFLGRLYGKIVAKKQHYLYGAVDRWVLLSKFMTERIPEAIGKSIVIEGMINSDTQQKAKKDIITKKLILYTGAVSLRNGCLELAKAFLEVPESDARLLYCGLGDAISAIQELARDDKRIICLGQLEHSKVLELQNKAWVLVNPRQNSREFSRYSFPSKLLEYYISGTPVLMYKIDGVPEEYYDYCIIPHDNSLQELTYSLIQVLNMSEGELAGIANKAREFVLREKNYIKQCSHLFVFMNTSI